MAALDYAWRLGNGVSQHGQEIYVHLIQKTLELAQRRRIPILVPARRNHRARHVEGVEKGVDEDEAMHRVAKVTRHVEHGDDGDDAYRGHGRSRAHDDHKIAQLLRGEVDLTACLEHRTVYCLSSCLGGYGGSVVVVTASRLNCRG